MYKKVDIDYKKIRGKNLKPKLIDIRKVRNMGNPFDTYD